MTLVSCVLGSSVSIGCSSSLPSARTAGVPSPTRHHWLGLAAGGSGYVQVVYRYRLLEPLALEVGSLGASHAINGSFGLLSEAPLSSRWAAHVGSGVGFGALSGDVQDPSCPVDTKPDDCKLVHGSTSAFFAYFRAGPSLYLGRERRDALGLDVGAWVGTLSRSIDDVETSRRLLWPMAGVFYLHGF